MSDLSPEVLVRFHGATTLCYCWKIAARNDGPVVRATDHDVVLTFRGEDYMPGLALEMSAFRQTLSLAPEPLDIRGALNADGITIEDLRDGVWDGASVMVYRVDWRQPETGVWIWSGYMTEISEDGSQFRVGLASIKSDLERTTGRVYGRRCDATFGGSRCGVDVQSAPQSSCDRRFATCRDVFSNADRFRGFPHMPGNDAIISGPGEKRDGSSRGIER